MIETEKKGTPIGSQLLIDGSAGDTQTVVQSREPAPGMAQFVMFRNSADGVVLIYPKNPGYSMLVNVSKGRTLGEWIDSNFGDNAVLDVRIREILSELERLDSALYQKTVSSDKIYTLEELEAMAEFIGMVRLPRDFNISKVLKEAEEAYYDRS